ncbi:MAG: hypothetical protein ACOC7S_00630 [Planctomycetota bacterium]
MAFRPYENLIEGELDNRQPGKVTGWLRFVGMDQKVTLELEGDFHRDIRGTVIRLSNPEPCDRNGSGSLGESRSGSYMRGFSPVQTGQAGDITAGREPIDYVSYPYVEWYSEENGRVVLELGPEQIEVIGEPLDPETAEPVSREKQGENMMRFLSQFCRRAEQEEPAAE